MTSILVVEDSRTQAEYLRLLLEAEGFDVVVAEDGQRALNLLQASPFDLVLSDILMPGIDGYELCRRIKSHPATAAIPVILLTTLNDPLDILRGIENGADNYVTKPFDSNTLLDRIRYLFTSRRRRAGSKVRVGVEVAFLDQSFTITSEREQILDLLVATCEEIVRTNRKLRTSQAELEEAKAQLEQYARRVEGRARSTEGKYHRLMEEANDAILLTDTQGRVLEANRRMGELLGLPVADIVGRSFEDFLPEEEREIARAQFQQTLSAGQEGGRIGNPSHEGGRIANPSHEGGRIANPSYRRDNARLKRANGQTLWVDTSASVVELNNERIVLTILHDATERNRLEKQLRQSQKMEAVGRLAGGVAHDFNNMLTVINGYCEVVLTCLESAHPAYDMVAQIGRAGERAAGLTRQLLAFSRQQVVQTRVLNLNAIVADMGKLLRRLIGENIELATALDAQLGQVLADPGQIEQVLLNLAINARDAMPKGGRLTIETANVELDANTVLLRPETLPGPYVLLAVSDTGNGMDEATLSRIFEPFFTTKEQGKGTGLGLATVYGIVKQAGGYVYVYSEPGRGACFKVYLPRVPNEADQASPPAAAANLSGTETVLLVEDEEVVRTLTRNVLSSCGYQVLEATNAGEALGLGEAHTGPLHLLVTDVVMPGLGGRELAERLAALRPGIKVLYLSGYAEDAIVRHGVLSSAAAFLQKPYTVDALVRKVREVLDRTTAP